MMLAVALRVSKAQARRLHRPTETKVCLWGMDPSLEPGLWRRLGPGGKEEEDSRRYRVHIGQNDGVMENKISEGWQADLRKVAATLSLSAASHDSGTHTNLVRPLRPARTEWCGGDESAELCTRLHARRTPAPAPCHRPPERAQLATCKANPCALMCVAAVSLESSLRPRRKVSIGPVLDGARRLLAATFAPPFPLSHSAVRGQVTEGLNGVYEVRGNSDSVISHPPGSVRPLFASSTRCDQRECLLAPCFPLTPLF
ncbi:hypothetical protein EDB80DRAFT_678130 [Ilyonectria destructans]|nr:hypothetical protein EDB80DRAFT_678130 [Ilyonectria destructans]